MIIFIIMELTLPYIEKIGIYLLDKFKMMNLEIGDLIKETIEIHYEPVNEEETCHTIDLIKKKGSNDFIYAIVTEDSFPCVYKKEYLCNNMICAGYVGILKWARQNNCIWNKLSYRYAFRHSADKCLLLIKWLYIHGCPMDINDIGYMAMIKGYIELMNWAKEYGWKYDIIQIGIYAASKGDIHLLKWVQYHDYPWTIEDLDDPKKNLIGIALKYNQQYAIRWLINNGFPFEVANIKKLKLLLINNSFNTKHKSRKWNIQLFLLILIHLN